jgi:cation transporter-like permease
MAKCASRRIVSALLLFALSPALISARGVFPSLASATLTQHATGCHSGRLPDHAPVQDNYRCCISGHDVALAPAVFSVNPSLAVVGASHSGITLLVNDNSSASNLQILSSSSPPDLAPLRI